MLHNKTVKDLLQIKDYFEPDVVTDVGLKKN